MSNVVSLKNKTEMDFDECVIHVAGEYEDFPKVLIDARLFHKCLGVRKRYDDWFEDELKFSDFTLSDDYFGVVDQYGEYVLTLKMARELALLSRSERGVEVLDHINSLQAQLDNNRVLIDDAGNEKENQKHDANLMDCVDQEDFDWKKMVKEVADTLDLSYEFMVILMYKDGYIDNMGELTKSAFASGYFDKDFDWSNADKIDELIKRNRSLKEAVSKGMSY